YHSLFMSCIPSSELFDVPDGFDYCGSPVCLSTGDVVGLSFVAQMGFVSALSVGILLVFVAIRWIKNIQTSANLSTPFVRTNIDGLMLNLLVADLIMSLGAILDIHWASSSQVSCGQMCTAQGVIQLVGETAVALFTLAITLLTFIAVVRGRAVKASVWVWGGIALGVWAYVALWAGIGGTLEGFYAPTPYWCWISREYKAERIGAEYIWLWISGFGSLISYTPLHLILRGNIKWDPIVGWASLAWSWQKEDSTSGNPLLWYLSITDFQPQLLTRPSTNFRVGPDQIILDFSLFVAAGMPTASTSKPGISRLPTAGGSRIPIAGGTRIPSIGGRSAVAGKALAKEKEDATAGKKRGLVLQKESPNPKARKILRTSNAIAPPGSKPTVATQKPTVGQKRSLGSPPILARKRQRLDAPVRSSPRKADPLDVIAHTPTPPRAVRNEDLVQPDSPASPPRTQAPIERARSTTAFNFPVGDQSSLLGGVEMDVSSAGLYSDFESGRTPSPIFKKTTPTQPTTSNNRRSSAASTSRRSSVTPKPRQKSATPRRSPKSARRSSATPRRYQPQTLPPPVVTPTAMQAKKEARRAEAQAKLAAARTEVDTRPEPAQAITAAQARLAAAQAEAEKRLRMSMESEDAGGLSVVQEESYQEEESERDGASEEGEGSEEEVTEVEQPYGEDDDEDEEEGEDTLQPLRDEDEEPLAANEVWSSQTETPRASSSKTPRARGTTTPAFKPATTPATRPTTTPAYKPTTTPATVKPAKATALTTTPATAFKGKRKALFQDTPHPQTSESPSEYDPGEDEEIEEPPFRGHRPSLGFSMSQLSLDTPHHPLRSKQALTEILRDEGEIANRTRSRRASGDGTRRDSLAGVMNGLKLAEGSDDLPAGAGNEEEEEGNDDDDDYNDDDEGDETVRRPRKSITATPKASRPSYSTTPRDYPSTTPRNYPSTTPRALPSAMPDDTSTTPRYDPTTSGSTTPFHPPPTASEDGDATTTPKDDPSPSKRKPSRPRKSDSPTKGRGRGRGRGSRGGASPARRDDLSVEPDENEQFFYGDQSISTGQSPARRGRGSGRGRGRASPRKTGSTSGRMSRVEMEQDSGSDGDFTEPMETTATYQTVKKKSPMKVEVVIPRRSTTAYNKSISKTPVFKPTASTSSFKPTSATSSFHPSTSASSSRSTTATSSFKPSASTSTSAFSSSVKVTLQQPTPDLSSLDRSPGSQQDMITEESLGSRQEMEHTDEGEDMSASFGPQPEFPSQNNSTTSQDGSTSLRQDMDVSTSSRLDQDMRLTDEIPETSLPGSPAERHETTKLPSQSSFSHLLERDMTMRSERTAAMRMETSYRTTTMHVDVSHRSTTTSRSASVKSHTPATKKKPVPKKTPGLKILPDSQASRVNAFTPRAPQASVDDSIEFTPASGLDFNESHIDFDETPAAGTKFAQSTPFVRNGARPSLGLGSFQQLHLDDSAEEVEEIPDSQAGPSEHDSQVDQPERTETTPQREISVAVDTSSPNRSLRTERVATPRAPRLSNPMDDEDDEDEPELPPSPSAGRSNFPEGNGLPDGSGINGRRLSDILMLRAKQARNRSGDLSQDQSGSRDVLGTGEMTRLSDQAKSVLKRSSGSRSQFMPTRDESQVRAGNHSASFGASTSGNSLGHSSRDRSGFGTNRDYQEQVQDYDASVRFDGPSRLTRRSATPVFRHSDQLEESDDDEVSSIPDQTEELRSSGASITSPAPSGGEEEYGSESEPEGGEEMDYDENGEPIIKLSGPPEALVKAKSALIQLGYVEDEERMERYSRTRDSRSRSRSISRAHDSTRNISAISSSPGHLGDRTTGLSRSQMMMEASRYEDWEPPSRYQLRQRKWTEHEWRMLAHYMRRVQKSQALMSGMSSRHELDLRMVDIPAVVERFVEEEAHGVRLEGEWDPTEIAGRVEFLIKTEGYKKDGSWRSTLANITVPGFSTQRTRRYEPEEDSPEVESPAKAKGKMLPTSLSEVPGPSRIAAAQKQVTVNMSRVIQSTAPVAQTPKQTIHNAKPVSNRTKQTAQTTAPEPIQRRSRQEPESMSIDQPSPEEPSEEDASVEEPSVEQPSAEQPSFEESRMDEPPVQEHSVEDESMEEQPTEESFVDEPTPEEPVAQDAEEEEGDELDEGNEGGEVDGVDEDGEVNGVDVGDQDDEEFDEEDQHDDPSTQPQTYQVPLSGSPAHSRSPPKSRRQAETSVFTNRGLEASMRSTGAPPTPIARFFGTISSYISGRPRNNPTGEPSMPILKPVSRDPIDLIDDGDDEPLFPVLNHVPTPIRPTPARRQRQKRVEPRIDIPALQHISPPRPITGPARPRPRMRRAGSVKELAKSFELMEEKSREEAEIARNVGMRRVVSDSGRPRLIPAQVHYVPPSAPVQLNRPKVPRKPARTAPAVPLLPAVPPRAAPAPPATRKTLKQPTRTRPAPPSAARNRKRVVPKKEVEVITISDSES
ncbi:unnamed protein product, partial [Rhizoctonia solani]